MENTGMTGYKAIHNNIESQCGNRLFPYDNYCEKTLCQWYVYVWKMNFFPRQLGWHWLYWRQTLYRYTHVEQISFLVSFFSKMRDSYLPPSPYQGLMDTFRNVQQNPNFLTDRKELIGIVPASRQRC